MKRLFPFLTAIVASLSVVAYTGTTVFAFSSLWIVFLERLIVSIYALLLFYFLFYTMFKNHRYEFEASIKSLVSMIVCLGISIFIRMVYSGCAIKYYVFDNKCSEMQIVPPTNKSLEFLLYQSLLYDYVFFLTSLFSSACIILLKSDRDIL